MANFRRGAEAIQAAATRTGGGKFTPTFQWEKNETKYLMFLTPVDEIPTVLMHRFIIVGYREETGKEIYENFISRRDPALDGPEGYDPLIDRFGVQPSQRCIALAVEVTPEWSSGSGRKTITGFDVATRQFETKDEGTKEVPNVALVIESPFTFFNQLTTLADMGENIEDSIFAVKRTGGGTDTSYTFLRVGEAFDVEDDLEDFFAEFDFEEYLEELADEEKMHEWIDPLPDDATVTKYPPKGKGKKGGKKDEEEKKPARSTRTRRTRNEEPADEPEPEVEPEPEADAEPEEATTGRRSRRFSDLKRERTRS